tara:strand:- start:2337 stop:3185 length:849 start_codon:yes stop_codon:yes gene_type:complete
MEKKFLTKNTKVTIKEEAAPNGLKTYEKVHKEDGTINNDALKAIGKKLEDYYGDELKELDPVLKVDREQDATGDVNVYDVEALGTGMQGLKYDDEGSEVFKKFMKRMDDLNDTSEYDKEFGTKDGFGETDEKDDTYEKLEKASDEYKKNKYDEPNPEIATRRLRVQTESKNDKMKRLNFKTEFSSVEEVKELIPENYKVENHTFLMTDGNQTFKMRWDESLNEATVLNFRNEKSIKENVEKMKKLYDFQYGDVNTKTNDYTEETKVFKNLMESVKDKNLLSD